MDRVKIRRKRNFDCELINRLSNGFSQSFALHNQVNCQTFNGSNVYIHSLRIMRCYIVVRRRYRKCEGKQRHADLHQTLPAGVSNAGTGVTHCSGSLEPEYSCHDRDWIMELPMEADIRTFTGILTPEDASVASCFPFDITISLSWFPLLSIPPLHSAIP